MTLFRAQVVHKHRSGVPRDHFVNTFWFLGDDATDATAEGLAEKVRDFYVLTAPGSAGPIMALFGFQVAHTGHEVRMSPINVATGEDTRGPGMPPQWVETFDHIGRDNAVGLNLPSEVAVCLSFKSTLPAYGAVPPARKRGRVYIGPFMQSGGVHEDEAVTEISRPTAAMRQRILDNAGAMAADDAFGVWGVYSRPYEGRGPIERPGRTTLPAIAARPGAFYQCNSLWVDNAFDTVRRRGEKPTSRLSATA